MKPIKRAIALCWMMLVACFAIKLFGGNWFEVVCTNEHFSMFCEFVEQNTVVYVILSFFVYVIPASIIILSVCQKPKPTKQQLIFVVCANSFLWAVSFLWMITPFGDIIKSIVEFVVISIIPVFVFMLEKEKPSLKDNIKKNWYRGLLGNATILTFQFLSLVTKNVGVKILNDNLVITYILLIDYYIMSALFYLYILKKEG